MVHTTYSHTVSTLLESSSTYRYAHKKIKVISAIIVSINNPEKTKDITTVIQKLIATHRLSDTHTKNTLTIDTGRMNRYSDGDIDFGHQKKMELKLAYDTGVTSVDVANSIEYKNLSTSEIVENTDSYIFGRLYLDVLKATVKSCNCPTKQKDITDVLKKHIYTLDGLRYILIDTTQLNVHTGGDIDPSSKKYLEITLINDFSFQTLPTAITQANIQSAVNAWVDDPTTTEAIYGHIKDWDTSAVTNMTSLFQNKTSFNDDISKWNVSAVTNMRLMFFNASAFNGDISKWDVSAVTTMWAMFYRASAFNGDINQWNVSTVTTMERMFYDATAFNGDISNWDVSAVTTMEFMFYDATTFNGDISKWDVSAVTTMRLMFFNASAFNADISKWDVSAVTTMEGMFRRASAFNGDISKWNVSAVTTMESMFQGATAFNGDISSWDVSAVTTMEWMFYRASAFNRDISKWDVSVVTTMEFMFFNASVFNGDISSWNVSAVTNMFGMFSWASAFNGDISKWDVSAVTNMEVMFFFASAFNGDISKWDVSAVTNMPGMFSDAAAFNGDISRWNVSAVTTMNYMFDHAHAFNGDISQWDVSAVTTMKSMFEGANTFGQNLHTWAVNATAVVTSMFKETPMGTGGSISPKSDTPPFSYFNQAPCFDQDTVILCPTGHICVKDLKEGDKVVTTTTTQLNVHTGGDINLYTKYNEIEQNHGTLHGLAWRAEEGIRIAQLKKDNLLSLKSDVYRIESEIVLFKINIDLLKSEIENDSNEILNIDYNHGRAHSYTNIMSAVKNLRIFDDAVLIQELLDKSFRLLIEIHYSHKNIITDLYDKRLEQLQLEMDLKKKQSELESLIVLIIQAEKEVADDSVSKRETIYANIEIDTEKVHHYHETFIYDDIYDNLLNDNQDVIMNIIKQYDITSGEKEIVQETK